MDRDRKLLQHYIETCSNWGRWGDEDQLGALNLVGAEPVRRAAGLVRQGATISLTLPYDQAGPQPGGLRANPQLLTSATGSDYLAGAQDPLPAGFGPAQGFGFSDDIMLMPTQAGTQWDSLSHIFWEGMMWNGRSAADVTSRGARVNGVENYTGGSRRWPRTPGVWRSGRTRSASSSRCMS